MGEGLGSVVAGVEEGAAAGVPVDGEVAQPAAAASIAAAVTTRKLRMGGQSTGCVKARSGGSRRVTKGENMTELLTRDEIEAALAALEGWHSERDALVKDVPITPDSFRWLTEAVQNEADEMNHHPDIDRTDRGIRFRLSTHSAGGVTPKDVELAARIDQVLSGAARDKG